MKDDAVKEIMQLMGVEVPESRPAGPPERQQGEQTTERGLTDPGLDSLVDTPVTIEGTARDAALGAVLLTDNRTPVYIDGLVEWDPATSHKRIRATGTLRRQKLAPDPTVGPDGGISHGVYGDNYVLQNATWNIVP